MAARPDARNRYRKMRTGSQTPGPERALLARSAQCCVVYRSRPRGRESDPGVGSSRACVWQCSSLHEGGVTGSRYGSDRAPADVVSGGELAVDNPDCRPGSLFSAKSRETSADAGAVKRIVHIEWWASCY